MNHPNHNPRKIGIGSIAAVFALIAVAVACGKSKQVTDHSYVYVANSGSNNITVMEVNQTSGMPTVSSSYNVAPQPTSLAIIPDVGVLLTTSLTDQSVSAFGIGSNPVHPLAITNSFVGATPQKLLLSKDARFAYIAQSGAGTVATFTVDGGTGVLRNIASTAAGNGASGMAMDPSGQFLFVTNSTANTVSAFKATAVSGVLTPAGSQATDTLPTGVAVDARSRFIYVANATTNDVSIYSITAITGALNPVVTNRAVGGTSPQDLIVDTSGNFLYVVCAGDNTLRSFTIQANGDITPLETKAVGTNPQSLSFDKTNQYLYVINGTSNDLTSFSVSTTNGLLSLLGTTPTGGSSPRAIVTKGYYF